MPEEEHPKGTPLEACKCRRLLQSLLLSGVLAMDSSTLKPSTQEEMLVVALK